MQVQMLMLYYLGREEEAYNVTSAMEIQVEWKQQAFERTCSELMQRHEILRTVYRLDTISASQASQRVMEIEHLPIQIENLPQDIQHDDLKIREYLYMLSNYPFDLENQPPVRFHVVIPSDSTRFYLVVVQHHIVTDAKSSQIFWSDFDMLYSVYSQDINATSPLEPCKFAVQYRDFARWHNHQLHSSFVYEKQDQYWKDQLQDNLPKLELPTDFSRPQTMEFRGAEMQFEIDVLTTEKFLHLSRSCRASDFITTLTMFHLFLCRLANTKEVVIGCPFSGRMREEVADLMGYFVNTLPLRLELDEDLSFVHAVKHVRSRVAEAVSNMDIPFSRIVSNTKLERDPSRNALYDVMFAWVEDNEAPATLKKEYLPLPQTTSKFDLMLTMQLKRNLDGNQCLEGKFQYRVNLFKPETIRLFIDCYSALISHITEAPEEKLCVIPTVSKIMERKLVSHFGKAGEPRASDNEFLDTLVWKQARRTPKRIALKYADQEVTYSNLERQSNLAAQKLLEEGVLPGAMIGIMFERGIEMIIAIIGILKTGSAFVPYDPEFPDERIAYMIKDSGANIIMTTGKFRDRLKSHDVKAVLLEGQSCDPVCVCATTGGTLLLPERASASMVPAYLFYTSGSTGRPKGVLVNHSSILTTIRWTIDEYQLNEDTRILQSTAYILDGFMTQVFPALFVGGTVCITKQNGLHDIGYIAKTLEECRITHCVFVPSYFSLLLKMYDVPDHVKNVILVGESFSMSLADSFYRQHPRTKTCLVNEYGPTEASVTSTWYKYSRELSLKGAGKLSTVPIGKPIYHHSVLVLDEYQRVVPVGVPGELYIGGAGIATAYWNLPEQTQQKFVHINRYTAYNSIESYYRTGDVVKWTVSGDLVFMGRKDNQIKLHGMRIELQEIENVLLQNELVTDAIVIAVKEKLVAHVIMEEGPDQWETRIFDYLKASLPLHMLPWKLVKHTRWPRTPGGKTNRKVLEAYCTEHDPIEQVEDQPRITTRVERMLQAIWSEALGVRDIAPKDSFFELGGNSIQALHVISLAKAQGLHIELAQFFHCNSLLEMANLCLTKEEDCPAIVPLNDCIEKTPIFFIHGADGLVWRFLELAKHLKRPCFGVQSVNDGDMNSIDSMASHYWDLIQRQQRQGPYQFAGFSFGCRVAYELVRIAKEDGQVVLPLLMLDGAPFSTCKGNSSEVQEYYDELRAKSQTKSTDVDDHLWQIAQSFANRVHLDSNHRSLDFVDIEIRIWKTRHWDIDHSQLHKFCSKFEISEVDGTHATMLEGENACKIGSEIE